MATNDFKVIAGSAGVIRFREEALGAGGGLNINAGEPTKVGGTGDNYAVVLANGDPEFAVDVFLGVSARAGSATSNAGGFVEIETLIPGVGQIRGTATTAANADSDTEILALLNDQIGVDYSAQTFTLDEDEGQFNKTRLGLQIINGDAATSTLVVRTLPNLFSSTDV